MNSSVAATDVISLSTKLRSNLQTMSTFLSSASVAKERGETTPPISSPSCTSCLRAFSLLRGRRECNVCNRSICRKCAMKATKVINATTTTKRRGRDPTISQSLCTFCAILLFVDAKQSSLNEASRPSTEWSQAVATRCTAAVSGSSIMESPSTRSSRAKTTSCIMSPPHAWSLREQSIVLDQVVLSPVDEEPILEPPVDVLYTIDTSEMTRLASTDAVAKACDAFQHISTGLHSQAALLTQMRLQMATQRRRRTQ